MTHDLRIDRRTGSALVGHLIEITPGLDKFYVEQRVSSLLSSTRDFGNGYQWLYLKGLSFGAQPCGLGLCFSNGNLCEISWSVQLPNAPMEGGWPTRAAIDQEIEFVRRELEQQLGCRLELACFQWGQVWSGFDENGFLASNGIRYSIPSGA